MSYQLTTLTHPVHAFSNIANIKIRNVKLASKQIKIVRYFHNDHNVPKFSELTISCILQISSHKCPLSLLLLAVFPSICHRYLSPPKFPANPGLWWAEHAGTGQLANYTNLTESEKYQQKKLPNTKFEKYTAQIPTLITKYIFSTTKNKRSIERPMVSSQTMQIGKTWK